jgi:hypothetical protein
MPSILFSMVNFEIGSCFLPRMMIPLLYASCCSCDKSSITPCTAIGCSGVLWNFCSDWPWTMILSISASMVASFTGVGHQRPTESGHSCLILDLRRMFSVFHYWKTKYQLWVFHKGSLSDWGNSLKFLVYWVLLSRKDVCFCKMLLHAVRWSYGLPPFY